MLTVGSRLVLAAGAAAAVLTFAFGDVRFFPPAFVLASVIGAVLGLPLYF
jgi:hypothetical protein